MKVRTLETRKYTYNVMKVLTFNNFFIDLKKLVFCCCHFWLHPSPLSAPISRLYLLHREKKDYDARGDKEGGK